MSSGIQLTQPIKLYDHWMTHVRTLLKKTYKLYDYSNFWGFLGQNLNFGAGQLKKI